MLYFRNPRREIVFRLALCGIAELEHFGAIEGAGRSRRNEPATARANGAQLVERWIEIDHGSEDVGDALVSTAAAKAGQNR